MASFQEHARYSAAMGRLEAWAGGPVGQYAKQRNYDLGPEKHDNVSCLSPFIRHRVLLEEDIVSTVLKKHAYSTVEKYVEEVVWRTYWKGFLELRPHIWSTYCDSIAPQLETFAGRDDYNNAISGNTGIDAFDFWLRELKQTGYLHNHSRMWFASIWIHTLKLPWALGAKLFYDHLLDGDPASNTLSWRWVAGMHTVGKTYLARNSNIGKYTNSRFNPQGLATEPHVVEDFASNSGATSMPFEVLPNRLQGIDTYIIWPDDWSLSNITASNQLPKDVLLVDPDWVFENASDTVRNFRKELFSDLRDRLKERGTCGKIVASLQELRENLTGVTGCIRPSVGEAKDILDVLTSEPGVEIKQMRRTWDNSFYPHCKAGFFRVRKQIPKILQELGIK